MTRSSETPLPVLPLWDEPPWRCRLVFPWCNDRYGHRLEIARGDWSWGGLASREGGPEAKWPVSPPLQQLTLHTIQGRPCALLLGMAGKSHWSVSIERAAPGRVVFDVACRLHGPAAWLGSSYTVHGSGWHMLSKPEVSARKERSSLAHASDSGHFQPRAGYQETGGGRVHTQLGQMWLRSGMRLSLCAGGNAEVRDSDRPGGSLTVVPRSVPDQVPATVCWTYALQVDHEPESSCSGEST